MTDDDAYRVEDLRARQGELEDLVGRILDAARRQGASGAEAAVSYDTGLSATVRMGEVETVEFNRDRGLGVTVYFGHRKGSASTADWSAGALDETVAAACEIARHTGEDPCNGLAPADRLAREIPDLDLYHPWGLSPGQAIAAAKACEDLARAQDERICNSEGATLNSHQGITAYGNSHGFLGAYPRSRHSLSCSVIARDDSGMERDYWYTVARAPEDLEEPESVGREAAIRAVRRLGARRLTTREAPVVFAAEIATGLMGHFVGAIHGGRLYRKASFLVDSLGQTLFPDWMYMEEQPHLPRGLGSAPFDNQGVATAPRVLVEAGALQGYVLDSYSACRLGMETTGNAGGIHNLVVRAGDEDLAGLLARMDTGLLVTEVMGQGINYVTGDYSRGAAGFWVEGGEVQFPVHEITIAGNLREMYAGILGVGRDVDRRGAIQTGSILVGNLTIAGE